MAKVQFRTFAAMGDGMAWCVGTYETELEAKRAADEEQGRAYVVRLTSERIYENKRRSPDKVRPFRDVLEKIRPA